jgi:hypothetical protein
MAVWAPIDTQNYITVDNVRGLMNSDKAILTELLNIYNNFLPKNAKKNKYYEGNISVGEVNLGIALPTKISGFEIGCSWGAKAVDVLAARSMFDGYVSSDGNTITELDEIVRDNNLIAEYIKACRDELKFGCTFATLSGDEKTGARVRFHSPQTAAAKWDGEKQRIKYGFAIIATDTGTNGQQTPTVLNMYTDNFIIVLIRDGADATTWAAYYYPHKMGRPLMEALIWNATSNKPFGRSRIKKPIRELINGYVRTVANASIGLEFATAPQKYLLGITDEQYDAVVNEKFKQYVGNIIAATTNPETGEKPTFGQLQQGTISPHVEMLRILATQFSAATGLPVTDTGVINDANPTSSDAITAQTKTLVSLAEELNTGNQHALNTIALMALAIKQRTTIDKLPEEQQKAIAHFKNPALPSVAATTDAAVKIASVRSGFGETDVFLEMVGFDQADIRRIKAQEVKARGLNVLAEIEAENGEEGIPRTE